MARDKVTVLKPAADATKSIEVGIVTKQAVTVANGIEIEKALENKNNSLQIFVETTATADGTLTIKAGNEYPNKILGDLTTALKGSAVTAVILEDISRFENRDGSIHLDFSAGFTGNVWAVAKRVGMQPAAEQA
jgi:hypothetical protein